MTKTYYELWKCPDIRDRILFADYALCLYGTRVHPYCWNKEGADLTLRQRSLLFELGYEPRRLNTREARTLTDKMNKPRGNRK